MLNKLAAMSKIILLGKKYYLDSLQAFLHFHGFDFRNLMGRFNAVYNSILFSSPTVLLSNLPIDMVFPPTFFFYVSPH